MWVNSPDKGGNCRMVMVERNIAGQSLFWYEKLDQHFIPIILKQRQLLDMKLYIHTYTYAYVYIYI